MLTVHFFATGAENLPVLEYIQTQDAEARAAILAAIQALAEEFPSVVTVSIKHLAGKLWELRVRDGRGIQHRILYAVVGQSLVLLSAFTKKTQKTPVREIALAAKRLKQMTQ